MLSLKRTTLTTTKTHIQFIIKWLQLNWINILLCTLLIYILVRKNVTLQISLNNDYFNTNTTEKSTQQLSMLPAITAPKKAKVRASQPQLEYIQRFAKVAQGEMQKFGIPASITLAQGLLESKAGKSPLATKNNNHFGIKCFSKQCQKGHCSNYLDDSHKDFFRIYPTAWDSFRAHSEFLQGNRYKHLIGAKSYKVWASGLVKAGYATDPNYGKKLIQLIENLELYRFDK